MSEGQSALVLFGGSAVNCLVAGGVAFSCRAPNRSKNPTTPEVLAPVSDPASGRSGCAVPIEQVAERTDGMLLCRRESSLTTMNTLRSPGPACVAPTEPRVVVIASVHAAIALTVLEYFGRPEFFARHFPRATEPHFGLYPHLWWAAWTITMFLVVPAILVRVLCRHRLRDYGLTLAIERKHWWLYLGLFGAVLPIVLYAGSRSDFRAVYPFYRGALQATTGAVLAWEAAYLTQFLALEFFFRGFLVLGLGRVIGRASIWVAMVPYCMIHYHKPPAEAFAAIVAGVVLGEVAYRTRSIAGGAILHVGVAATMELLAINGV